MTSPEQYQSEAARHAQDHWRADGIPLLIGAGIYLLVAGTLVTLVVLADENVSLPDNWFFEIVKVVFVGAMVSWAFWVIPLMIWLFVNWEDIVEWFKLRLTYPRVGYVAPPSYWDEDEEVDLEEAPTQQNRLQSWLRTASRFWIWGFVLILASIVSPESGISSKIRIVLLCILLTIRAIRFGFYPETVTGTQQASRLRRFCRYLRSVFNSFFAWMLIASLIPPLPRTFNRLLDIFAMVALTAFIAWAFTRKDSFWLGAALCVFCSSATFLISQNGTVRFSVAVLTPGIYAACLGAVRLFRHLRANPVRTA